MTYNENRKLVGQPHGVGFGELKTERQKTERGEFENSPESLPESVKVLMKFAKERGLLRT
jgi:hypothetical protein